MGDYIDRKVAIDWFLPYLHTGESVEPDVILEDIRSLPSSDVAQVVHGRWISHNGYCECNICKNFFGNYFNYCPNCAHEWMVEPMTETDLLRTISVELCKRGCIVHRTNSGTYYTKDGRPVRIGIPGQSDLQGHRPDGRCFYLEIKKPGQKPRENQIRFLESMRSTGAIAGWADSVEKAVEIVEKG